jgi:hypothetical protein
MLTYFSVPLPEMMNKTMEIRKMKRALCALSIIAIAFLLSTSIFTFENVEASESYTSYIVVYLQALKVYDDKDLVGCGEIELCSVVLTETAKEQAYSWPTMKQDSSWHEANTGDHFDLNAPIFALKEDQMGDYLAVLISVTDNDEIPDWVGKFTDAFLKSTAATGKEWFGAPSAATATKLISAFENEFFTWLSGADKIGTYARIFTRSDWEGTEPLVISERQDDVVVIYEIRRIQVPNITPPLAVRLLNIRGFDWGDSGGDGEPFVHTRVRDDTTIPPDLIQMSDFGPVDKEVNRYWIIDNEIFRTASVGPFLHIEIDVWDSDAPWIGDDNDMLGIFSDTYFPDSNWEIGTVKRVRRQGVDEGDVEITFQIVEMPFSAVRMSVTPQWGWWIEPGGTAAYTVQVENFGNTIDTYGLSVDGLDSSWCFWRAPHESFIVQPNSSYIVTLVVEPPRHWSVVSGAYNFTVRVISLKDSSVTDSAKAPLQILPFRDVKVIVAPEFPNAEPGSTAICTIGVQNLGNIQDDYEISLYFAPNEWGSIQNTWTTLWPRILWDIDPGKTGTGLLMISVPNDFIKLHAYLNFTVRATSLRPLGSTPVDDFNGVLAIVLKDRPYITLDIEVDVGSIHFRGEIAEFYVRVSRAGIPVDVILYDMSYTLYNSMGHTSIKDVEHLAPGLYRLTYQIKLDASTPTGTWTLVIDCLEDWIKGTAVKSFFVSPTLTEWNEGNLIPRLVRIERDVGYIKTETGYIKANLTEIKPTIMGIDGRIVTLQTEVGDIKADLSDINARITSIDGSIATIESDIGTMQADISEIETELSGWTGTATAVTTDEGSFNISTLTNSTLEERVFLDNILSLRVSGVSGTRGRTYVVLPKALLNRIGSTIKQIAVTINDQEAAFTYTEQSDTYAVAIAYTHSTTVIKIFLKGLLSTFPLQNVTIIVAVSIAAIGVAIYVIMARKQKKRLKIPSFFSLNYQKKDP